MTWQTASLKEESTLITKGTTPTTLGYAFSDSGVPFLRAQNLVDGSVSVEADPLFISESTHRALGRSKIKADDLLISIAGTIGRASLVPSNAPEMNCNQAVAIVRPSERVDRRFLLHWLASQDALSQMAKSKVTGTISNLSLGQIGELVIPLPPLEEQKRIAAILDQADALRRLRRRALDRLNTLGQAIFHEMFGDLVANPKALPRRAIGDVIEGFETGKNIAEDPDESATNGARVLKVSAVTSGTFKPWESKPLPKDYVPPPSHYVKDGDLLFSRANTEQLIGATAVVTGGRDNLVLPDKLWRFRWRSPSEVDLRFIQGLFRSPAFRDEIRKRSSGTSGSMKNIGQSKVLAIEFGYPSIDAQTRYRTMVTEIDARLQQVSASSDHAQTLFTSLQHRAFRGEL